MGQLVGSRGLCRELPGYAPGAEVQHCSPSPSRGLGRHWGSHPGGVLIEEGALGFQECLESVYSQTLASSEG